jgi:tetratricopeptide (TPR) repeat protein
VARGRSSTLCPNWRKVTIPIFRVRRQSRARRGVGTTDRARARARRRRSPAGTPHRPSLAAGAYRDGLAIVERGAAADRSNTQWQNDLSLSYGKIGNVLAAQGKLVEALKAYRDSLAIRERLAAADRSNTQWQSDLSLSYDRVSDVLAAQGKLEEALKAYRDSLAIMERLAAADRSNALWQCQLHETSVGPSTAGQCCGSIGRIAQRARDHGCARRHRA